MSSTIVAGSCTGRARSAIPNDNVPASKVSGLALASWGKVWGNTYRVTPRIKLLSATLCTIVKILYQIFPIFPFASRNYFSPTVIALQPIGHISFSFRSFNVYMIFLLPCNFVNTFGKRKISYLSSIIYEIFISRNYFSRR